LGFAEHRLGVLQAAPSVLLVPKFAHAALVGQFNRVMNRRHPLDDTGKVDAPFARIQPSITGQLNHAFAGVSDTRQGVRNVQEVQQIGGDMQQLAQVNARQVDIERIDENPAVGLIGGAHDIERFIQRPQAGK
jgi:hypothetical protein